MRLTIDPSWLDHCRSISLRLLAGETHEAPDTGSIDGEAPDAPPVPGRPTAETTLASSRSSEQLQ